MKRGLLTAFHTCFDNALDLRIRIFNVLAVAGILGSVIIGIVNLISGAGAAAVLVDAAAAALSAGLLYYSYSTQKYQRCYLITIAGIFFGLFPYLYFRMGCYHESNDAGWDDDYDDYYDYYDDYDPWSDPGDSDDYWSDPGDTYYYEDDGEYYESQDADW